MTRRLIIFFYLPKGNKKISDIAWENKERKKNTTIDENQNPIIVALLIGQETVIKRDFQAQLFNTLQYIILLVS